MRYIFEIKQKALFILIFNDKSNIFIIYTTNSKTLTQF